MLIPVRYRKVEDLCIGQLVTLWQILRLRNVSTRREGSMQRICLMLAAAGFVCASMDAGAQVYPSRPITMIAPFPAGGPLDRLARILAERMRVSLGQPVIIENVTGASGSIGTGRVARAAA